MNEDLTRWPYNRVRSSVLSLCLVTVSIMFVGTPTSAASPERWIAYSKTAVAITGNVTYSRQSIKFANGKTLALTAPKKVTVENDGEPVKATFYRVNGNPVLKNGNRLCGKRATFIAVFTPADTDSGKASRWMAVFSGSKAPSSINDDSLCAIYTYVVR
jgi:hypothetical protein